MTRGKIVTNNVSDLEKKQYEDTINLSSRKYQFGNIISRDEYSTPKQGLLTRVSLKKNAHIVNNIYFQKSRNKWKAELYNEKTKKVIVIGRFATKQLANQSLKQYRIENNM